MNSKQQQKNTEITQKYINLDDVSTQIIAYKYFVVLLVDLFMYIYTISISDNNLLQKVNHT